MPQVKEQLKDVAGPNWLSEPVAMQSLKHTKQNLEGSREALAIFWSEVTRA